MQTDVCNLGAQQISRIATDAADLKAEGLQAKGRRRWATAGAAALPLVAE